MRLRTLAQVCQLVAALLATATVPAAMAAAVDFSERDIARLSRLGPWPQAIPDDPGNALSSQPWAEALGAQLFRDPRLSGSGRLACIHCHNPQRGFAEGSNVAVGAERHVRNTQGLFNVGLQRWFGWDGGADSLWSATLRPLLSDIEMAGKVDQIAAHFRREADVLRAMALATPPIDIATLDDTEFTVWLSKAIAAYTRTLVSPPTQFDRFRNAVLAGDLKAQARYPDAAKRGLKTFLGDANCVVCHTGPNLSNGEFHDIGRPFFTGVGAVDGGRYGGIKRMRDDPFNLMGPHADGVRASDKRKSGTVTLGQVNFGQWRTPSLRNLSLTAPYMHDGSLATLRDVVDYYADIDPTRLHSQGESLLNPLQLDNADREDLVRFLETLSEPAEP